MKIITKGWGISIFEHNALAGVCVCACVCVCVCVCVVCVDGRVNDNGDLK